MRSTGYDRDFRLALTQTSAVSEHAHNTGHLAPPALEWKFIDRDPHCYTRRVKEAIHIRLHPNNIDGDSGIEIPEGWMICTTADRRGNNSPKQRGSKSQHSIILYKVTRNQST